MKSLKIYNIIISLFVFYMFVSCKEESVGEINLMIDGTLENVMIQESEIYKELYPDIKLNYKSLPDSCVIDSLIRGKANVVVASRELTNSELKIAKGNDLEVKSNILCIDALTFIVNNSNSCSYLDSDMIKGIMTGEFTKWNDFSKSKSGDIKIVCDKKGSGNLTYIRDSITNRKPLTNRIIFVDNYKTVIERVKRDSSALGILSVSSFAYDLRYSKLPLRERIKKLSKPDTTVIKFPKDFKTLGISKTRSSNAYLPYSTSIFLGDYPFCRKYYILTTSSLGTAANGFYRFMLQYEGQRILMESGLFPSLRL